MVLATLTVVTVAVLAFGNGANDVSKGVATLAGSGRTSYRTALAWGTLWTCLGAIASLVISIGLVKAFTSAIVAPEVLALPAFALAVAAGAGAWVVLASVTGLPVSTTHALTGAIVGVAVVAGGPGAVGWWMLVSVIAAPLALSPLVSAGIGYAVQSVARRLSPACVCVQDDVAISSIDADGSIAGRVAPQIVVCTCANASAGAGDGMMRRWMPAGTLHWGAAAVVSFARGVNDNAKLAAIALLGLPAVEPSIWAAFAVTAAAMTIGSYAAGLRVTRTLGERVVDMDTDTGLAAALVAAALVLAASFYMLPVSTTHVATGAIVGAGVRQGGGAVDWRRVRSLIGVWIGTLPIAAALAAITAWLLIGSGSV
jgi:PiT family inorganic phosphate transporter